MNYYSDAYANNNIIYGNKNGEIRTKIFIKDNYNEVLLFSIPDTDKYFRVGKVVVSSNGLMWAAYSQGGYVVYIGTINQSSLICVS